MITIPIHLNETETKCHDLSTLRRQYCYKLYNLKKVIDNMLKNRFFQQFM